MGSIEIVITACGAAVISGLFMLVSQYIQRRAERRTGLVAQLQKEQSIICYGVLCCLKGLKEQGCNGPVTDALNKMEKHLNEAAHDI